MKNEQWQKAIAVLEGLTNYYKKDSDLFYVLGLSYYQLEQYQNAIIALKKTLHLGGTILREIPTGSAPSNDIMIQIAKAYAKNGDKNNAMIWLKKGFASRYDEKPFLKSDAAFNSLKEDVDFLNLFGQVSKKEMTREEAWKRDIDYLLARIKELHFNLENSVSKIDFENRTHDLKTTISESTDEQIIFKIMSLFGALGSGHNIIIPTSPKTGALKKLPIQMYQFEDGMFIVNAKKGYEKWIGYEVKHIGNKPIDEALKLTGSINARDNDMQTIWLGPYFLSLPAILKGLHIIDDAKKVTLNVKSPNDQKEIITLKGASWNFTGFPKLPKLKKENQPLYLSKTDDNYWSKLLTNKTMYVPVSYTHLTLPTIYSV